jgi:hypothetical protein
MKINIKAKTWNSVMIRPPQLDFTNFFVNFQSVIANSIGKK